MDTKGPEPSIHKLQKCLCQSRDQRDGKFDISGISREVAVLTRCLRLHNCNLCKFFCNLNFGNLFILETLKIIITKLIHSIIIIIITIIIIIIIIIINLCHCSPYFCNSNIVFLITRLSESFEVDG